MGTETAFGNGGATSVRKAATNAPAKSPTPEVMRCLENPSPAEQDLAVQIQSGTQRGEQMRREVESFAEGPLAKTAAVVFADIIVQRILNPKAT